MNHPRFVVFKNEDGKFCYKLYNERQRKLLTGTPAQHREDCIQAIRELYKAVQKDHQYHMQTKRGQFYYQVTNEHHTVTGTSVMYRTMAGIAYGICDIKQNVPVAMIHNHSTLAPLL